MPFDMTCNMCGVTLRVQEDQVGSIINCPSCGQVIFVQLPTAAGSASDTLPLSQETLAVHSGPSEPELADFLRPAAAIPGLAPQTFAETDTVSSLAEMLEGEETGSMTAPPDPGSPMFAPQPEPSESIDLSFLTPKLDSAITLDSNPGAQSPTEPSPEVGSLPWEQPAERALIEANTESIFEPEQLAAPLSPGPIASPPRAQPGVTEFPWMPAPESDEPATATSPSPAPFDFTAPAIPAQQPAALPVAPAPPTAFMPSDPPAAQPSQPEFCLPGARDESTPTVPSAFSTDFSIAAPAATAPTKPPSRFGILAAAYVSGVIFGLIIGKFVFGRAAAAAARTGLEYIRDDGDLKKTKWIDPKANVPQSQLKRLGETVEIAGLSITAHSVRRTKVTKIHSFSQNKETSNEECLVLRLVLQNTSKDLEFAPLDPMFVRPHPPRERPTYSFIEVPGERSIPMFDLHKFSEFDLEGQPFEPLKPGEKVDAIVVAAEGSPAQAKGKMVWRVQLRAGAATDRTHPAHEQSYSTIVGFEFTPDQIRSGDG